MAKQLFTNNANATMSGTLSVGGATLNLSAGQGERFPTPSGGDYFLLTIYEKDNASAEINYEIIKVTSRTADTLTIERDEENVVGVAGGRAYPSAIGVNPSQVVYVELRYTAFAAGNTLTIDDNLASLSDKAAARTSLELGSAAITDASDYATAAQGATADSALQPSDIGAAVQAYDADLAAFAGKTAPSGAVVGTTDTQTLTNKRINPRVISVASAATITPTGDTADQYNVTALATNATIAAPSGTPVDAQKLLLRIKDNATARTLTWTTSAGAYRAIAVTLPTTTVLGKVLYIGMVYNAADGYWDVIATGQEL